MIQQIFDMNVLTVHKLLIHMKTFCNINIFLCYVDNDRSSLMWKYLNELEINVKIQMFSLNLYSSRNETHLKYKQFTTT